jgi:arylsulfatase A-like enzyme
MAKYWPMIHKMYAAMITKMDMEVDKLLNLPEELVIDENILILFTSYNGNNPDNADSGEKPFSKFFRNKAFNQGGKGKILNGAFQVPAAMRWKKVISPRQVSDHTGAFWYKVSGQQYPANFL